MDDGVLYFAELMTIFGAALREVTPEWSERAGLPCCAEEEISCLTRRGSGRTGHRHLREGREESSDGVQTSVEPDGTQRAVFVVKRYIEDHLCRELNLDMVQVPLIVGPRQRGE